MNKLKTNETFDLAVLSELIVKMSGMEANKDPTADQLEALSGGPNLQQQAGSYMQIDVKPGVIKEKKLATARLRDALCKKEFGMPLLILISQQLGCVIFGTTAKLHMKLISTLNDQCQETLIQLADFMQMHLSPAQYAEMLPDLTTMCRDFNLDTNVAFHILRPKYAAMVTDAIADAPATTTKAYAAAAQGALASICDEAVALYPAWDWTHFPPSLFVMFWCLSL